MTVNLADLPNLHARPPEDRFTALASGPQGLTDSEAKQRLAAYIPNQLPTAAGPGPLRRSLLQFHNVLIYVLVAAAGVTWALQHWVDTGVILAVVLANAVIGFIQEGKAEAAMTAICNMLAPRAAVLRDGRRTTVEGADLAPGDIVLLEAGDKGRRTCASSMRTGLRHRRRSSQGNPCRSESAFPPWLRMRRSATATRCCGRARW
ncbi:hypothetical protein ABID21_000143 [Pseudorhizobium tarimense]|uniref:Cation-transporting P-type ATPase N-terminal domain-containing protein n=1 Tax=Pseudorhizobium tarimense TaxID=1079109 RepID=A0ABV2H0I8_9HYPH|nr:cation-transporting P-type ATPase [Pseudorhizobium tarimense]MCJ8517391.1 cation-transporting P-type ATPase [Pseudorhizobium tarimense]